MTYVSIYGRNQCFEDLKNLFKSVLEYPCHPRCQHITLS